MTDPREIDFSDSFVRLHQFDEVARPADYAMLRSEIYYGLRKANSYHNHLEVVPDRQSALLGPRATYEGRFYAPLGSFLYAISAYSNQAQGFDMNLLDASGGALFTSALRFANENPLTQGNGVYTVVAGPGITTAATPAVGPFYASPPRPTVRNEQFFLQFPRATRPPGLYSATLSNRADVAARVQAVFWFIRPDPPEAAAPPNLYNDILTTETELHSTIAYYSSSAVADARGNYPWEVMPPNGRPLRYESPLLPIPAPATVDYPLISFVVPSGYECAIKSHRHKFVGTGFEGSGDLIWRITIDGVASAGYDTMAQNTIDNGESYEPISGAILAHAGQLVQYTISVSAGSTANGTTIAAIQGHYYPQS